MTRRSRYPVASFGPELLAALIKGATEKVIIPLPTAERMNRLQMRIHMLRGAMGREKHPQYDLVQKARTSRQWDEDKVTKVKSNFRLEIQPNDREFADAITAAGISVDAAMQDILEDKVAPLTPTDPGIAPAPSAETSSPSTQEPDPYADFK